MSIKYVIADGLDVNFYAEKQTAEAYMEAIDVINGVYTGYDSEGRILRILPKGQASMIILAEDMPNHAEELRMLLIRFLRSIDRVTKKEDLGSLLEACESLVE